MSERLADAEDLEASRKIAAVEASMADNDRLLAQITPEIERLKEASNSAAAAELLKSSSNCDAEHHGSDDYQLPPGEQKTYPNGRRRQS